MNKYTLTLVFDKDVTHILMRHGRDAHEYDYIVGSPIGAEDKMLSAYRSLEEVGITHDDIRLRFVREETVNPNMFLGYDTPWCAYVACGVLNKDMPVPENCIWVRTNDYDILLDTPMSRGNYLVYLYEAKKIVDKLL